MTEDKPEGAGWDNLGPRRPKFIALHRMWGTLGGTDQHFGNPKVASLTDYGLGIEAIDGAENAGRIHRYNDPLGEGADEPAVPGDRELSRAVPEVAAGDPQPAPVTPLPPKPRYARLMPIPGLAAEADGVVDAGEGERHGVGGRSSGVIKEGSYKGRPYTRAGTTTRDRQR